MTVDPVASRPRLLLVEDDPQLAPLLGELLGEDYDVEQAADGHRALHLGLTRAYDVMVVDRGLPAVEGLDLIGRLRSRAVFTPALVLTARATVADKVEGLDAGAQDYLTKPFEIDELLARLRALLRRGLETAQTLPVGAAGSTSPSDGSSAVDTRPWSCPGGRATCWRSWRGGPVGCSAAASCWVPPSTPTTARVSSTPTSTYLRRKLGRGAICTVRGLGYRMGEP